MVGFSAPSFSRRPIGLLRNATAAENGASTAAKPCSHPAKLAAKPPCLLADLKMPSKTSGCSSQNATTSNTSRTSALSTVQREPISPAQPLSSNERQRPQISSNNASP
jgi:hypothetical protein